MKSKAPTWRASDTIYTCEASLEKGSLGSRVDIVSDPHEGVVTLTLPDAYSLARWILDAATGETEACGMNNEWPELLFELRGADDHVWRLFEDGRAEGFPEGTMIINHAAALLALLRSKAIATRGETE